MSPHKENSVYHRNLKARLRLLGSPSFWAGIFGLSLVSLFAWQYFTNEDWIDFVINFGNPVTEEKTAQKDNNPDSDSQNQTNKDGLGQFVLDTGISEKELQDINAGNTETNEELETAASIFTLPKNKQPKSPETSNNNKNGDLLSSNNKLPQTYPSFINPFVNNAQRTLSTSSLLNPEANAVNNYNTVPQTTVSNINSVNQPQTQTQLPINNTTTNPQTSASNINSVNQPLNNTSTNLPINLMNNVEGNTSIISPTNNINNPPSTVINQPPNNLNSFTYLVQPQTAPISNIPAPVNIPVQQVTSVNTNLPISTNINSVPTNINPGVGASALQPSQIEPPQIYQPSPPINNNSNFPGQSIGNGQINTFSNP